MSCWFFRQKHFTIMFLSWNGSGFDADSSSADSLFALHVCLFLKKGKVHTPVSVPEKRWLRWFWHAVPELLFWLSGVTPISLHTECSKRWSQGKLLPTFVPFAAVTLTFSSLHLNLCLSPPSRPLSLLLASPSRVTVHLPLLSLYLFLCISLYIYIYAVESKLGPKIAFFWVKTWSKFFSFFLVFQKSSSFCRENEILKKNEQKKRQKKTPFFWVKTWSNFVAQHTWTKFWLNLGPSFDSTFLLIFGYFYLFEKMPKPLFL